MVDNNRAKKGIEIHIMKRRDFIKLSGMAVVGVCFNGCDIGPIGKVVNSWLMLQNCLWSVDCCSLLKP